MTRYDDCVRVQKDTASFTSVQANVLGPQRVHGDPAAGKVMNVSDPPRHTQLRRLVSRSFTPRRINQLEPYLRAVAADAIETALETTSCDLVKVISVLPVAAISALLDVPPDDWNRMLEMTSAACATVEATDEVGRAAVTQAHSALLLYCRELMTQAPAEPGDNVISQLIQAEEKGELTEEEVLLFFDLLMLGGNETTRHAAAGALLALIEFPDQWDRLRQDPRLVRPAVDEILRWTTPSKHVIRRARHDLELQGRTIRANDDVVIWYASANFDERAFADPDRLDLGRTPNEHLALGSGSHFCLGSALARLELSVFLEELVARVASAEILTPPRRMASTTINGLRDLHVRLDPR
ncbi:cytochrome P450 [Micromonospora sp. NBC_01740]|uniref:cytochrome P450 n=1 Tax=Micromonospora sp. NBC_01740 TaxID=2975986 RepID=UPI002E0F106A|nr:cytochrome P450 [Micromonospora sp. NBC_01740]